MPASGAVDITEFAAGVDFADTVPAVDEKYPALLVNNDAGSGVPRGRVDD
jgi:hypothetical protein